MDDSDASAEQAKHFQEEGTRVSTSAGGHDSLQQRRDVFMDAWIRGISQQHPDVVRNEKKVLEKFTRPEGTPTIQIVDGEHSLANEMMVERDEGRDDPQSFQMGFSVTESIVDTYQAKLVARNASVDLNTANILQTKHGLYMSSSPWRLCGAFLITIVPS